MKRVMFVFGTRPEAIKMAPVILAARQSRVLTLLVCAIAQHRGMLDQVTGLFGITPDIDLDLMQPGQDLFDLTARLLTRLREVYREQKPDLVLVQGDTTTAFAGALAAFYARIPVGHVEAGLRTNDIWAPYPEEYNRRAISPLASLHFAPTQLAVNNLLRENLPEQQIYLTGNTSIDALLWASKNLQPTAALRELCARRPFVLMTAHRRENFGQPLLDIFAAVKAFALANPEVNVIYPVHPNPNVLPVAREILGPVSNIHLIEPVGYGDLNYLLSHCVFLVTDSGGLQEEAPAVGKPTLVFRETTERPEAVEAGCALLVGHDRNRILRLMEQLKTSDSGIHRSMAHAANPFGDGTAARKIISILEGEQNEARTMDPGLFSVDAGAGGVSRPTLH